MIKILRSRDFNIAYFLVDNVEDVNELKNTNWYGLEVQHI